MLQFPIRPESAALKWIRYEFAMNSPWIRYEPAMNPQANRMYPFPVHQGELSMSEEEGMYTKGVYRPGGFSGGKCPYCGSSDIVTELEFSLGTEVGPFGITYRALAFLKGTQRLQADLCSACGTLVRLYVLNTKRNWYRRKQKDAQP